MTQWVGNAHGDQRVRCLREKRVGRFYFRGGGKERLSDQWGPADPKDRTLTMSACEGGARPSQRRQPGSAVPHESRRFTSDRTGHFAIVSVTSLAPS